MAQKLTKVEKVLQHNTVLCTAAGIYYNPLWRPDNGMQKSTRSIKEMRSWFNGKPVQVIRPYYRGQAYGYLLENAKAKDCIRITIFTMLTSTKLQGQSRFCHWEVRGQFYMYPDGKTFMPSAAQTGYYNKMLNVPYKNCVKQSVLTSHFTYSEIGKFQNINHPLIDMTAVLSWWRSSQSSNKFYNFNKNELDILAKNHFTFKYTRWMGSVPCELNRFNSLLNITYLRHRAYYNNKLDVVVDNVHNGVILNQKNPIVTKTTKEGLLIVAPAIDRAGYYGSKTQDNENYIIDYDYHYATLYTSSGQVITKTYYKNIKDMNAYNPKPYDCYRFIEVYSDADIRKDIIKVDLFDIVYQYYMSIPEYKKFIDIFKSYIFYKTDNDSRPDGNTFFNIINDMSKHSYTINELLKSIGSDNLFKALTTNPSSRNRWYTPHYISLVGIFGSLKKTKNLLKNLGITEAQWNYFKDKPLSMGTIGILKQAAKDYPNSFDFMNLIGEDLDLFIQLISVEDIYIRDILSLLEKLNGDIKNIYNITVCRDLSLIDNNDILCHFAPLLRCAITPENSERDIFTNLSNITADIVDYGSVLETLLSLEKVRRQLLPLVFPDKRPYSSISFALGGVNSKGNFYQRLGVNKQCWNYIVDNNIPINFIGSIKNIFNTSYSRRSGLDGDELQRMMNMSVKEFCLFIDIVKGNDDELYNIKELLRLGLKVSEIHKAVSDKNLPLGMLKDYLSLRNVLAQNHNGQINNETRFNFEAWPSVPKDTEELRRMHDQLSFLRNISSDYYRKQEAEEQQKLYDDRVKQLKKLEYKEDMAKQIIVCPKQLEEIVYEGQDLHHCVASYVSSVASGKTTILFLRDKDTPHTSYCTIEIRRDFEDEPYKIRQVHTAHNGDPTKEDVEFIRRWAKEKGLDVSTVQSHYGALCCR